MIINKEIENRLKDLGLNSYESKLWISLLSKGMATASELSELSNVPRSRVYDVLEILEKKGFVMVKLGKPTKYLPVQPDNVIEQVKRNISDEADVKIKMVESFHKSDLIKDLKNLHTSQFNKIDPLEYSGTIKGSKNLYVHLDSVIKKAKTSVLIVTTERGVRRKADLLKGAFKKAKANGVRIRIAAPFMKVPTSVVSELSKYAEVKHCENEGRFTVVDENHFITMVNDDSGESFYDSGIWVSSPFFISTITKNFNDRWENMKPVK